MRETIYRKVAELIAKETKIPVDRIKPDTDFEALGMDSLDGTTMLFELEKAFNVAIPDEEPRKLRSLRQVVAYLEKLGVAIDEPKP